MINVKHFYNEYGKFTTDYAVTGIILGDMSLDVSINVDESTKKLKFLSTSYKSENNHQVIMDKYQKLLTELYGEPEVVEDELNGRFMKYKNVTWFSGNYLLKLSLNIYDPIAYINILTEEHENNKNDFRVAKWGDTIEQIKAKEGKDNLSSTADIYMFYDNLAGMPCIVGYVFTDNRLSMAKYLFKQEHSNKSDFIDDYNKIVGLLSKKYGEPYHNAPYWKNTTFKGDPSNYGLAISAGHLIYTASWNLEKTTIDVCLSGENYEIAFDIQYLSKKFKDAQQNKKEQETLDLL